MNRHSKYWETLLLAISLILLGAARTPAQTTVGGIRGMVVDVSGAIVPGVVVVATNTATNLEYRAVTNSEGIYQIARIPPGKYVVTAESQGFRKAEYTDVEVKIGTDTVVDIKLEVGALTETVTVDASRTSLVQMDTVQVSASFEVKKVQDLPVNVPGGGLDRIALLVPGVTPGFGNVNSNGVTLSANGNRARANNFTIDGVDNNDLTIGGPNYFVQNPAAVQEFQVITNNFSAEYGRNQGAIVNIVSRTGTNAYHGSLTWTHQDRKNFDSLTNIERRSGEKNPPPNLINLFGYALGGPVIKNRAFFYTTGYFRRNPGVADLRTTSMAPTPEGVNILKSAFPNNPAVQYYANYSAFSLPLGNPTIRPDVAPSTITVGSVTVPVAAVQRQLSRPNNQNEYTARADARVSDKDNVWGRFFWQKAPGVNGGLGVTGWTYDNPFRSQQAGGGWTRSLTNRALNEFRFNYSLLDVLFGGGTQGGKGQIPHPNDIDKAFTFLSLAGFRAANGSTLLNVGPATNLPQGRIVEAVQFSDTFAMTTGRHQMKMGADIRYLRNKTPFLPNVNGAFTYSTGTRLANNDPNSLVVALGPASLEYTEWDKFFFFQDDWRIRDNFTLNLGIRYENTGQPINLMNDITAPRESDPNQAFWRSDVPLEGKTVPRIPTDNNNIAPRFGFVYSPRFSGGLLGKIFGNEATVISGGFGIAYDATFYNLMLNISTSSPLVFLTTTVLPMPDPVPTGDKVRAAAVAAGAIAFKTFDPRYFSRTVVSQDFRSPYSEQWSLRWQRSLTRDKVFEVRYVGTHGVGLFQTINRNPNIGNLYNGFSRNAYIETAGGELRTFNFPGFPQLFPAGVKPLVCVDNPNTRDNEAACNGRIYPYGITRERINGAQSIYHGLQSRFDSRFANQLITGLTYTWSHTIDNSSEVFSFAGGNSVAVSQNPLNLTGAERGNSGFDARHVFTAHWMWELPWWRSQRGVLGHFLGGWQVNGILRIQSERLFTPTHANASLNPYEDSGFMAGFFGSQSHFRPFSGNPKASPERVAITDIDACLFYNLCGSSGGVPILKQSPTGYWLMNDLNAATRTFTQVTPNDVRFIINGPGAALKFGTPFGNIGRNMFRGDRVEALDMSVFKKTRVTEGVTVEYRLEMFNALNHPTFGIPNSINLDNAGRTFYNFQENSGGRRTISMTLNIIF